MQLVSGYYSRCSLSSRCSRCSYSLGHRDRVQSIYNNLMIMFGVDEDSQYSYFKEEN